MDLIRHPTPIFPEKKNYSAVLDKMAGKVYIYERRESISKGLNNEGDR